MLSSREAPRRPLIDGSMSLTWTISAVAATEEGARAAMAKVAMVTRLEALKKVIVFAFEIVFAFALDRMRFDFVRRRDCRFDGCILDELEKSVLSKENV